MIDNTNHFDLVFTGWGASTCILMIEMEKNAQGVLVIIKENKSLFNTNNENNKNHTESSEFREYGVGAQILRDLGVRKMILLTNSKKAIIGLEGFDLKIVKHKELHYG